MNVYTLTLTPLSPLSIGAGDEHQRSPLMEYVYEGGKVHYIDTERLNAHLLGDPSVMDAFVESVRRRTGQTKRENGRYLVQFLRDRLGVELRDVVAFSVPAIGRISGLVRAIVKNGRHPYIPGSSIKGAIRTAVLVSILLDNPTHPAWKMFKDALRHRRTRDLARNLEAQVFQIPRSQRGNPQIEKDPFRHVSISDTELLPASMLQVGTVGRYKLAMSDGAFVKKPQHLLNIHWEMLPRDVQTTLTLGLGRDERLDFLTEGRIEPLFKRINDVSYALVSRELDVLDELEDKTALENVYTFYERLRDTINRASNREAYLRLGHAKTYFDQTVGIVADEEDHMARERGHSSDILLTLIRVLQLTRRANELENTLAFPRTRSFLCDAKYSALAPMGWVHLKWETA